MGEKDGEAGIKTQSLPCPFPPPGRRMFVSPCHPRRRGFSSRPVLPPQLLSRPRPPRPGIPLFFALLPSAPPRFLLFCPRLPSLPALRPFSYYVRTLSRREFPYSLRSRRPRRRARPRDFFIPPVSGRRPCPFFCREPPGPLFVPPVLPEMGRGKTGRARFSQGAAGKRFAKVSMTEGK